jgi:hypothetical protein
LPDGFDRTVKKILKTKKRFIEGMNRRSTGVANKGKIIENLRISIRVEEELEDDHRDSSILVKQDSSI